MSQKLQNLSHEELLRRCADLQTQVELLRGEEDAVAPSDYHAAIVREDSRYRVLFEEASDGIFILNPDGKIVAVNSAFAEMHGYAVEELQEMQLSDLDTPEASEQAPERLRRVMEGEDLTFEVEHYCKSGGIITLEAKVSCIEFGEERMVVAFHRDVTEEKRAKAALEDSERRYRLLADHAADLIWTMDKNHQFTYFSPSVERFLGYTPEECLHLDFKDVFPPESLAVVQKRIEQRRRDWAEGVYDKPARAMELEHIRKDGRSVWAEVLVNPIFSEDGRPVGLMGVTRDVSVRRAIQKSLESSEKRLRDITDSIPGIVFLFRLGLDGNFNFDYMSRGVEEYLDWTAAEICEDAARLFDEMVDEDRESYGEAMRQSAQTMQPLRYAFRIRRKDGTIIWWENNAVPQRLESGEIMWTAVGMDVTYLKQTEEALRESVREQEAIFDGAMVGIMLLSDRKIVKVNKRMADMLGYDSADMLGKSTEFMHLSRENYLAFGNEYLHDLQQGGLLQVEYELRHRDGRALQCLLSGKSINPVDAGANMVWIVEDVTALREEEARRLELERMVQVSARQESLANMAASVAHSFNNALQVVLGNLNFAADLVGPDANPRIRRFLTEADVAAGKAAELSRIMMLYVGHGEECKAAFSLAAFLEKKQEEMLDLVKGWEEGDVALEINQRSEGDFLVSANDDRVWELLSKLIENAREASASREAGLIEVNLFEDNFDEATLRRSRTLEKPSPGRYVALEVRDNGCGMDADVLEHIFEPYYSTKFIGRGLGLAAVLGIVRLHKGAVFVESKRGEGCRVQVLFPVA